jgi:hypothetical protein
MTMSSKSSFSPFSPFDLERLRKAGWPNLPGAESGPPAPARVPFTCFAFQVLDADVLGSIEASPWPAAGVLRLAAPWLEQRTIYRDVGPVGVSDRVAFLQLTPVDVQDDVLDLPLLLYQAIVDSEGDDRGPDSDNRFVAEGEAWARAALGRMPSGVFEAWQGCRAARIAQVQDRLVRGFLVPPAVVERIVGVPLIATRGLFPVGHDALRLEESARRAAEALATAKAAAEAIRMEAMRAKSIGALGLEVLAVRKGRLAVQPEPFVTSAPLWEDATSLYYGFRKVMGLELPVGLDVDGVRVLGAEEFAPLTMSSPISEASSHAIGFTTMLREKYGVGLDLGPVDDAFWTDRHLFRARELARQHAGVFLAHPTQSNAWRAGWLVELLVMGLLTRPDIATDLLLTELDGIFSRRRPPLKIPTNMHMREAKFAASDSEYFRGLARPETGHTPHARFTSSDLPSVVDRAHVAVLAANAASRGIISVGALIEPPATKKPAKP